MQRLKYVKYPVFLPKIPYKRVSLFSFKNTNCKVDVHINIKSINLTALPISFVNSFLKIKISMAKAIEVKILSLRALNGSMDQNAQPVKIPKINENDRNSSRLVFILRLTTKRYFIS
jgi:hypothetical protein